MKKVITITMMMLLAASVTKAQTTIAGWTFPTGTSTDANPDLGLPANSAMTITTQGGASAIDFSKNGLTTKAAQATGWDGGANIKWWQIEVNTTGYQSLKLSSKQTAGGANPGPRDWKAQYKVSASGTWTDIPNSTIITANNWTSGVLTDVGIPVSCNNQASVFIRWLMASDTSNVPPALVASTGTTKIDDIYITGTAGVGITETINDITVSVFPNPCSDILSVNIPKTEGACSYEMYTTDGRFVSKGVFSSAETTSTINVSGLKQGLYFLRIYNSKFTAKRRVVAE